MSSDNKESCFYIKVVTPHLGTRETVFTVGGAKSQTVKTSDIITRLKASGHWLEGGHLVHNGVVLEEDWDLIKLGADSGTTLLLRLPRLMTYVVGWNCDFKKSVEEWNVKTQNYTTIKIENRNVETSVSGRFGAIMTAEM